MYMKKILTFFLLTLSTLFGAEAARADGVLDQISQANASLKTMEAGFTQTKTIKANGKTSSFSGTMYYSAPDKLAMVYDQSSEGLVINGTKLFIRRGGKSNKGDTRHNKQMDHLSSTLFSCMKGDLQKAADDNNADISVKTVKDCYEVTIKARKKASKGFSVILLRYRKSDCLITSMRLEEFSGVTNEYTMTDCKVGEAIPATRFDLPKK